MSALVDDALPPPALLRLMNPVLRLVLRTPLGAAIGALALLDFAGRHSGRAYRVPVFLRDVDEHLFVITPAPWRANFVGGGEALVHHRGRAVPMVGTLDPDPEAAARAVRALLARGVPDRQIGLRIAPGHEVTADDMQRLDRRVIDLAASVAASLPG